MVVGFIIMTVCCLISTIHSRGELALAFSSSNNNSRLPARVRSNANTNNAAKIKGGGQHNHSHLFSTVGTNTNKDGSNTATSSIATATGVADLAFRLGVSLEKAGHTRSASAAFHEAATLYQCFLDGEDAFNHVTSLSSSSSSTSSSSSKAENKNDNAHDDDDDDDGRCDELVVSLLAYCCIRLGHLSNDAFGDANAASRLYQLATTIDAKNPNAVSYHGIGTCIEASLGTTTTTTAATASTTNNDAARASDGTRKVDEVVLQNNNEIKSWKKQIQYAIGVYRKANELSFRNNVEIMFHLAVALEVSND